jgi:hypothetical protein
MASKLSKIWKERYKIIDGFVNSLMKDEFIESVAKERNDICNDCEHKGNKCMIPKTGPCCNLCGCSLKLKTRSLSAECDLKKWKAFITPEEEDELEHQFKTEQDETTIHRGGSQISESGGTE